MQDSVRLSHLELGQFGIETDILKGICDEAKTVKKA
jgi:hypothetical protein